MGKLVVIEGIDGSGKSTQFQLLKKRLERDGAEHETVSFPRYGDESSALIKMYLGGQFGTLPGDVNAYAASTFFAVDRFASYKKDLWGSFYDGGGLVIADRYTTSNAVHQGAKLPANERAEFFRWLYDFEFRLLGLPKPDAVIYLDINAEAAVERLGSRNGTKDIHERDLEYLYRCAVCLKQAADTLGWVRIDASGDAAEIHGRIYELVKEEI
ncbi:MAG: deoxynucleoside kinase [Clostridiales bacterium]|nr:deoxynucleoside kinase [Clostridiales bacterium]